MTGIREEPRRIRPDISHAADSDVHAACSLHFREFLLRWVVGPAEWDLIECE